MFVYSRQEKLDIDKVLTFLRSENELHVNEFISWMIDNHLTYLLTKYSSFIHFLISQYCKVL